MGFEKTKPICGGTYELKVFYGRDLWQYIPPGAAGKQSQSKPISALDTGVISVSAGCAVQPVRDADEQRCAEPAAVGDGLAP